MNVNWIEALKASEVKPIHGYCTPVIACIRQLEWAESNSTVG